MGLITKLRNNVFLKNIIVLFTGAAAAQGILIVSTLLLSRLYDKYAFGIFTLFVAIINITTQIACLRYDYAIIVAETDEEATRIFIICTALTTAFSLLLLIIFFPFSHQIASLLNIANTPEVLLFIPITTFVCGMTSVLNYYNVRFEKYKVISSSNIIKSIAVAIIQIVLGFLHFAYWGLVIGQLVSFGFGNTRMMTTLKGRIKRNMFNIKDLMFLAKKHKDYPKYTVASSLANVATYSVLPISINKSYSVEKAGYFGMINRVLGLPLTLVSGAVSQVFIKKIADEQNNGKELAEYFNKVSKWLAIISIIPFALLFIFAEMIVPIVFGKDWAPAAKYLKYLIPLFAVRFVVTPISSCALVMKKQKATMIWQIGLLISVLIPSVICYYTKIPFETYLMIVSALLSLGYIIFYKYCYDLIKNNNSSNIQIDTQIVKMEVEQNEQQ